MASEYGLTQLTDPVAAPSDRPQVSKTGAGSTASGPTVESSGGMGRLPRKIADRLRARLPGRGTGDSTVPAGGRPIGIGMRLPPTMPSETPSMTTTPRTPSRPSRTPPPSKKVPMSSHCECVDPNGVLSIPRVIETIGGRQPTGLAKNIVLPFVMAEGDVPAAGAVLDLVDTTGAVWTRDAQVQRVLAGQFASRLWGMYINTLVLSVSGIQELLDDGTILNRQLEALWRSFQLNITYRNAAPINYTLVGGVGIPRHGSAGNLAAGAAVAPRLGPETWSLPSPLAFNATEVESAVIDYIPLTSDAPAQTVLNTGNAYVNAYFGGIMWKNDGTVVPPISTDCKASDFAAPIRVRASAMFKISR